jgi:starch phosphorylase
MARHKVNGVSALHSHLMLETIFSDFHLMYPERFCKQTNGITPRRWRSQVNPALSSLIDCRIGPDRRQDLDQLSRLCELADDEEFQNAFHSAQKKQRLTDLIARTPGLVADSLSLFNVQVKRMHEFKRQLLKVLHITTRYHCILAQPQGNWVSRTVIFAVRAASVYVMTKLIIRLIHDVARIVNNDPCTGGLLKVVFIPDYRVSLAEIIIPVADLSEPISTAGTEASGTGSMKFALNGALIIGT